MGILIFILILAFHTAISAQTYYEFDIHYGFGTSELSYNSVPGFAISVYPIKNLGVSAGLEYSWRWQAKTGGHRGSNPIAIDSEGDPFIFKYEMDQYEDEKQGKILQIPILLKYSNDLYYIATGLKIGAVHENSANISYEGLKTEGYYPEYELNLAAPLWQGFGSHKDSSLKTKISDSKTLFMLTLEGGVKYNFSDNISLLAGAFADYSMNKGFDRKSPVIERIEDLNGASIAVNDNWKSWRPWSVGAVAKLSFSFKPSQKKELLDKIDTVAECIDPSIRVRADSLPPPIPIHCCDPQSQELIAPSLVLAQGDSFQIPPLPICLLNREANFVFHYPETRTSPSDSLHLTMISQIADTLRAMPGSQLHCVGHSEKLISESVAYETAFQRSLRIKYTLSRFFGIEESRIFIYSQGSKDSGYRRAECFVLTNSQLK